MSMRQIANGKECEKALMYLADAIQRAIDAANKREADRILVAATAQVQAHLICTTT